ncbi:hypothetical protein MLD38_034525 [Melastoma candidum]|uniref:Uncharacterized protein n=1 Tax=Melastoma candidum TaxID=119954 RepID=A0ACB9MBJ6_9MYRT|nr:hypothetical protein MLD38_034525 [Melastoma candidum]
MHGRPRKPSKPENAAASAAKAEKLCLLQSQFLSNHHNRIYTKEALEANAKLLEINPEYYTAWNFRKLAVQHYVSEAGSDPQAIKSVYDEELRVVEAALRQNFKSYGAWHHRKWVLSKGHSSLDQELRLLDKLQQLDSRNFLTWNYRRFLTELLNRSVEDELMHTEDMIGTNFSNYSAWHNRSMLLCKQLKAKDTGLKSKDILSKEYELVQNAIFTDPDDQSGWFYHLWLIDQTIKAKPPILTASWPSNGSELIISRKQCPGEHPLYEYQGLNIDLKEFPVILYFNQAVSGVSSSTVNVESFNIMWKPLSPCNSLGSEIWMAYLNLAGEDCHFEGPVSVELCIGQSQGILSSSGSPYSKPMHIAFTVTTEAIRLQDSGGHNPDMMSWEDPNFCADEVDPRVLNSDVPFIEEIKENKESTISEWQKDTICREIAGFRDLLSIKDYKIGKLTLARLLMADDALSYPYGNVSVHSCEVLELLKDLTKSDPTHSRYYEDHISLVLLQQLTSSEEMLRRHLFCFKGANSLSVHKPLCLRLNNLSLTCLGSFNKLLGVQMLDLSNNELQSIEGLEAMQLLSCLNLSKNKLGSFTALEPLRHLSSLKALNVSDNEIGSHSIDTRRYLFSSPLSHNESVKWDPNLVPSDAANPTNYWEAIMLFKALKLTQLDIIGNEVVDDRFSSFLVKIMPSLVFLDGQKLV